MRTADTPAAPRRRPSRGGALRTLRSATGLVLAVYIVAHLSNHALGVISIDAQERISQRLVRLQAGLLGDAKFFDGIGELRIDHGPGYRV